MIPLVIVASYASIAGIIAIKYVVKERNWRYLFALPITYVVIHLGWAIGFLGGLYSFLKMRFTGKAPFKG
jgi:nicotinamide riboside transporter PnuC